MYHQRLANLNDAAEIAPLWAEFLKQRSQFDPSLTLKPQFDYQTYIKKQLQQPSTYGFLLEYGENKQIVGFLFIYIYDPTPNLDFPPMFDTPFVNRRSGGAIGMYIEKQHRKPAAIKLLVQAALNLGEELKISDIDLLISIEQTGVHKLLEHFGFTKAAIQYTKHYQITDTELPPLKTTTSENIAVKMPPPGAIPLRDPQTQQNVINPQGEQVFLYPLKDQSGKILQSTNGFPVYPVPLRDPENQDWVFNDLGELVICPVLLDSSGNIVEYAGIPQFCPPLYQRDNDKLVLKKDQQGNYLFAEPKRNENGEIIKNAEGKVIFAD